MKISLVLPTINRTSELENFLNHLEPQTFRDFELIVVDQNDDESIQNLITKYCRTITIVYLTSAKGASSGRNRGLSEITGEIIGFPDDDCWYSKNLLRDVYELFENEKSIDGLCGKIEDTNGYLFARYPRENQIIRRDNVFECSATPSCFLRKKVIQEIGTFDVQLGPGALTKWQSGDDTDYILRAVEAGFLIRYDPRITVFHACPSREIGPGTLQRAYYYGAGMGRVLKKHRFPYHIVGYYFLRPLGGSILSFLRKDRMRARFYIRNFLGRWDGWRSIQ